MNRPLNPYRIAVLLFISFALISNFIWFISDNSIVGIDTPLQLSFFIEFFYRICGVIYNSALPIWIKIVEVIKLLGKPVSYSCSRWPNGLNLTASLFHFILGKSLFSAKLSLLPYLFILLLSTYLIGRLIYSDFVGFMATFILFMYPIIFESSRQFQLDFPLTAMVALNILFLLKCNNFKDRKYSFLFGLSLGWAMLIKGQVILFIICPLFMMLYKIFKNSRKETPGEASRAKQLQNMIIFIIVAGLLASIWWAKQIGETVHYLKEVISFDKQKSLRSTLFPLDKKYSLAALSLYFKELFNSMGIFLFIVFFVSFLFFLKKRVKYREIYLGWLIPPFLVFIFIFSAKDPRFLMPIFPAMALITAWGLEQIKAKNLRISIVSIIVTFALMQFYIFSWCNFNYEGVPIEPLRIFGRTSYEVSSFTQKNPKINEVFQIIRSHTPLNRPIKIGLIDCISVNSFLETIYRLRIKNRFLDVIDLVRMYKRFLDDFGSLDFILFSLPLESSLQWPGGEEFRIQLNRTYKYGIALFHGVDDPVNWERLLKNLEDARPNFRLVGRIPTDRRTVYYIYKRIR